MPRTPTDAFFAHWFELLCIAAEARDKATEIEAASGNAIPHEALSAILFSAVATEAFINELAEAAARDTHGSWITSLPNGELIRDLAATLDEIEDAQGSIGLKYHMASKILSGHTFDAGKAPFQQFDLLIKIRNEIAHPRHRDRTSKDGYIEPTSSAIRNLQQQGLTKTRGRKPGDVPGGMSWLNELECGRTAKWAHKTAKEIIVAVLTMLPEDDNLTAIYHFLYRLREI